MKIYILKLVIVILTFTTTLKSVNAQLSIPTDEIYNWNKIATDFVAKNGSGHDGIPPMPESRMYAMTFIGIHDVINTILPRYQTYSTFEKGWQNANIAAAIAQVSFVVLSHELPLQSEYYRAELESSLHKIEEGNAKAQGITLGNKVAAAILKMRINDGSVSAQYNVEPGTKPGDYRFTFPFDQPPFNTPPAKGFQALPGWGKVKPFALSKPEQFRPTKGPYPLTSDEYAADYEEIKLKGCEQCPARTPDQTEYAVYWAESSCLGWNRIALHVANLKKLNAHELARLLALLHVAIADSYIASMDAKSYFHFWRPVTAIHLAEEDGNSKTIPDVTWKELGFPTVPVADHPSAHANAGGAAAAVLIKFFKSDKIPFQSPSTTKPGITRSFNSFSQAARENSDSRIYLGYHFRRATTVGEIMGNKIGRYISANFLPLIKMK